MEDEMINTASWQRINDPFHFLRHNIRHMGMV